MTKITGNEDEDMVEGVDVGGRPGNDREISSEDELTDEPDDEPDDTQEDIPEDESGDSYGDLTRE
jgi:hypothetical protein